MAERENMTTKILETVEGNYITVKGLRVGRVVDHKAFEEPAVEAWRAARDAQIVLGQKPDGQKGMTKGNTSKWG